MKYILISEEYEILGLDIQDRMREDNWYPMTDEAYEYAVSHNTNLRFNISDELKHRLSYYDVNKETEEITPIIFESDLTNDIIHSLNGAIKNRQFKNNALCREFIELGVTHYINNVRHRFSFKIEDQINFRDLKDMHSETVLVKGVDETEYIEISYEEFLKLYNKLNYNKFYNLMYLRVLNEYVESMTNINDIHKLTYEVLLPEEYKSKLDALLERYRMVYKEA